MPLRAHSFRLLLALGLTAGRAFGEDRTREMVDNILAHGYVEVPRDSQGIRFNYFSKCPSKIKDGDTSETRAFRPTRRANAASSKLTHVDLPHPYKVPGKVVELLIRGRKFQFSHEEFFLCKVGPDREGSGSAQDYHSLDSLPLDTIPSKLAHANGNFYRQGAEEAILALLMQGKVNVYDECSQARLDGFEYEFVNVGEDEYGCGPGWRFYANGDYLLEWRYLLCPF